MAQVLSTNIAVPQADPGGLKRQSGIHKVSAELIEVTIPGPDYGDGSGVVGDHIGDTKHHGGQQKAVYAFARERLDAWEDELGRDLHNGVFGENLTTAGIDWTQALLNQRFQVGEVELEVSVPRTPCRTFAKWMGERAWVRRFTESGDCGAYFRVNVEGVIRPGDTIVALDEPAHGFTMGEAFAAWMGDDALARRMWELDILPPLYQERYEKRFGGS
ncbi:MOSC domain-containing protein [Corynebacterium sp. CNCTC7651]|uniref:MOSC domain-containing protein n=1 Tax=Corynebacterium sp. CNCTC7651 TaxID=2815361 RepID=UPI001F2FB9BC|nr:MOSC domain-containing protein [Corynebacterium sp. CNCTC7651]UIZ92546.1 MOSC domain-containing protein [Corynebacterium sp. CNCTC7651]